VSASLLEERISDVIRSAPGKTRAGPAGPFTRKPGAPVIAAVDGSSTGLDAASTGARLARTLDAPLVLVYVRKGPPSWLGDPYFQRRLDAEMDEAHHALEAATAVADDEGVTADTEILEGSPARRIREFADHRAARFVVVGSRRRRFKRSVSERVVRQSPRPVVVAA
jgi:nucleotide-binding universal stress UspA family protein